MQTDFFFLIKLIRQLNPLLKRVTIILGCHVTNFNIDIDINLHIAMATGGIKKNNKIIVFKGNV